MIEAYASIWAQAMDQSEAKTMIVAKSALGDAVAARASVLTEASIATNVVELPDLSDGFKVKRSIYTGKAFADVVLKEERKILVIKKNAIEATSNGGPATVQEITPELNESDFKVKIII